jgi:hypothetical protein
VTFDKDIEPHPVATALSDAFFRKAVRAARGRAGSFPISSVFTSRHNFSQHRANFRVDDDIRRTV